MRAIRHLLGFLLLSACSSVSGQATQAADGGPAVDSGTTTGTDAGSAVDSGTPTGTDGGLATDAGLTADDGGSGDGGTTIPDSGAGSQAGACSTGIPVEGAPADTSSPTTVVGTGTAETCGFSQLSAAIAKGGVITFNCGSAPLTIAVTATLNVPIDRNTVIDGGNKITLDGGNAVQILRWQSQNFQATEFRLTLQHLALINGKETPSKAIPVAPLPCSQGWDDGEGGALFMQDGNLTVIDVTFTNNHAAPLGPDTGGGAIYILGSKHGALIVNSTFTGNTASNAGAIGGLFAELDIYDSVFTGNAAVGNGANNDDPATCSVMNNGQNEVGSGGNGGAIYSDGQSVNVTLCGDAILGNSAGVNADGGGLFFTSNNMQGTLSIRDTTMTGNTGGHWTQVSMGSVTNAGTAVGVNAKSITIANSTIQGVP